MKLQLVFSLAIIATVSCNRVPTFFVEQQPTQSLVDQLIETVESFIQGAYTKFIEYVGNFDQTYDYIENSLENLSTNTEGLVADLLANFKETFEKIVDQSKVYATCAGEYRQEAESYVNKSKDSIENCARQYFGDLLQIKENVKEQTDSIQMKVKDLQDLLSECQNDTKANLLQIFNCLNTHYDQIKMDVYGAFLDAREAVAVASAKAGNIYNESVECLKDPSGEVQEKLEVIYKEIEKCAENQ